jgi:hypothetical protein
MIKGGNRECDVCGSVIPKGTTYRYAKISPDKAALLLDISDPDMTPTWTQEADGTVRIDICLECHISMGEIPTSQSVH